MDPLLSVDMMLLASMVFMMLVVVQGVLSGSTPALFCTPTPTSTTEKEAAVQAAAAQAESILAF